MISKYVTQYYYTSYHYRYTLNFLRRWHERFPTAQRVIHRTDAIGTAGKCEILLEGEGSWNPGNDFEIIHTPGHTAGSLCVMVKTAGDTVLFTGDHLAYSEKLGRLEGFKYVH